MTRREMQQKIEELSQELRELKAKSESSHCHGCHCHSVIYYPQVTSASTIPWTGTWISTAGGNYPQVTG